MRPESTAMPIPATAAIVTPPLRPLHGRVTPPGSKSMTNRALLLAALASGQSILSGSLKSDDTRYMSQALRAMGVAIAEPDAATFVVSGTGALRAPDAPLFLGNAGTAMRFLTAAAAIVAGKVVVDGDSHMRRRPIEPLVAALRQAGVDIASQNGFPPVAINGQGRLKTARIAIDGRLSSQYVSAVFMIAPFGAGPIEIALAGGEIGARGYVDLTLGAMRAFGARIAQVDAAHWVVAPERYRAANFAVEPDASAATYLWAAEALTGGRIDLGFAAAASAQPDARAFEVIQRFPDLPASIDGAQMQDAMPTIAVLAAFNRTPVRLTGLANLRVKECDRIAALADGLNAIKPGLAQVEGDDLVIASNPSLRAQGAAIEIDSHADHRIAMSFALAGLKLPGIAIQDSGCVAKTYPGYWDALRSLGVGVRERPM